MKPLQRLVRLALAIPALLLLAGSSQCFAMMDIMMVDQAKAKELGMEVRTQPAGPDALWVELEFKAVGELKSFDRVTLDVREPGGKALLSASLKEKRPSPERVVVGFTLARAQLDKASLCVVVGESFGSAGYDLRLKGFVGQDSTAKPAEKAAAKPDKKTTDKGGAPAATAK